MHNNPKNPPKLDLTSPAGATQGEVETNVSRLAPSTPRIFTQKVNTFYKTISNKMIGKPLGQTRHFPAASKEWFNSIYAYNSNYLKNLPVLDKTLSRFLKSYFNNFLKKPLFTRKKQPNRLFANRLSSRVKRLKRLSLNKIFLGKAELKHSSEKVIITLFVFNKQKMALNRRLKAILSGIFPSRKLLKRVTLKSPPKGEEEKVKPLSLKKNLLLFHSQVHLQAKEKGINSIFPWLTSGSMPKRSQVGINPISLNTYNSIDTTAPSSMRSFFWRNLDVQWKGLVETTKKLTFNKLKFDHSYLLKISPLISRLYNKKVEFNIINLKNLHLDTDIFTQVIANKLKNRDNKVWRVLKSASSLVKIPKSNRIELKYARDLKAQIWFNKAKNLAVYPSILSLTVSPTTTTTSLSSSALEMPQAGNRENLSKSSDILNKLLLNVLEITASSPSNKPSKNLDISGISTPLDKVGQSMEVDSANYNKKLINTALASIKHKTNAGVRLEARGRLTRRFTAARSVFKLKWKGGLNNIDSSVKGLSAVILRGHAKSNVQYSLINSKNRNGAFGVRGWISGK